MTSLKELADTLKENGTLTATLQSEDRSDEKSVHSKSSPILICNQATVADMESDQACDQPPKVTKPLGVSPYWRQR